MPPTEFYSRFLIEEIKVHPEVNQNDPRSWRPLQLDEVPFGPGCPTYDHRRDLLKKFPYSPYFYDSGAMAYAALEELLRCRQEARDSNGAVNSVYLDRDWRLKMVSFVAGVVDHTLFKPKPPKPPCTGFERNVGKPEARACCDRAGKYNGYSSDGPLSFVCPEGCSCHD